VPGLKITAGAAHNVARRMPPATPFIVALDGPSDTGKSTLAHALCESLTVDVLVLPCYADLAGSEQPPPRALDADAQLRSLEFYLALDRRRRELMADADQETIVIADRSWLGLLAHTYAIEQTGGPSAYEQARTLVRERASELLQPDLVLFLALDPGSRRSRVEPTEINEWHTCDTLNEQINRFFTTEALGLSLGIVDQIDAAPSPATVLASAQEVVLARRSPRA
jgi:thymidylate kinase